MGSWLRRRLLPWSVWLAAMSVAGWLWYGRTIGNARGFVEGIVYDISSPIDARIASVLVAPGQHVEAGQLIAQLDDRELVAEYEQLEAEGRRIEAELMAVETDTQIRLADNSRSVEENVDAADLALAEARADRSVAKAELDALEQQIKDVTELVDKGMADKRDLAELMVSRAALRETRATAEDRIRQLDRKVSSARARRLAVPADATVRATEPLRRELEVVRASQEWVRVRKEALALRAPAAGEVTAVHLDPGEVAVAGTVIASIAGGTQLSEAGTPLVFACMSEEQASGVEVGEEVVLSALEGGHTKVRGRVDSLSASVAELPLRCWTDPRIPVWGRGVHVATDDPIVLLPGQGFTLNFTGRPSESGGRSPARVAPPVGPAATETPPTTSAGTPKAIVVPAELAARTRFEPSAILWSPARRNYIVVSDDTGIGEETEHVPWLFTMDETGAVDEEPLAVEGVKGWSDLESIAPAPDGGIYVLASQSVSKKGKRPAARQFFGHVAISESSAQVTTSVRLARVLEKADSGTLEALGVTDLDALDIEGMTATSEGGLLLGLKSPVDGSAIVWHLGDPDGLLAGRSLADVGLRVWGRIPLRVVADGADAPAGIAELLELPDRSLLVAATSANPPDPSAQDGIVVHVARDRLDAPRRVLATPGLKPEGLALAPRGDAIAIVFDTGASTPLWMEMPWPAK
jgi:multidrug resistance efflux pump